MTYKAVDTGQIAYFITKGYKYTTECKIDRDNRNKVVFVFNDLKQENIDEYWNSDFYKFKKEVDSVKKLIESVKQNNG